ncbi:hypothetical protein K402DRAFT_4932 [Aulographum hederae CBS 113979]|uniref:Uncharacterized protein n=1 Tax=Aulographum hederae CBS 113979 TaxID=1176131 RepID=A0A6G1HGJ7_9PEZI|nr:hypothetical protein K402DRAFT_4932 [Aulographum hederae CBS 113979]
MKPHGKQDQHATNLSCMIKTSLSSQPWKQFLDTTAAALRRTACTAVPLLITQHSTAYLSSITPLYKTNPSDIDQKSVPRTTFRSITSTTTTISLPCPSSPQPPNNQIQVPPSTLPHNPRKQPSPQPAFTPNPHVPKSQNPKILHLVPPDLLAGPTTRMRAARARFRIRCWKDWVGDGMDVCGTNGRRLVGRAGMVVLAGLFYEGGWGW